MKYTPIHIHSDFSLMDGISSVENIVAKAAELGAPGVSISDHGSMSGALRLYKEAKKNNINPIIGCELYINDNRKQKEVSNRKNNHLCAFAKNYAGYKNLVWLQGDGCYPENFYFKPRQTNRNVFKHSGGLIVTTACIGSEWGRLISNNNYNEAEKLANKYKEIFGDDFYIEIQMNEISFQKVYNEQMIGMARKLGIKMILGLDAHYVNREDAYLQELVFLLRDKKTIKDVGKKGNGEDEGWQFEAKSLWIKSYEEILECNTKFNFNYDKEFVDELLSNTNEINGKVNIEIPLYDYKFPTHKHANNVTSKQLLLERVKVGLDSKIKEGLIGEEERQIYTERINSEVNVLTGLGRDFSDYFLMYQDVVNKVYDLGGSIGPGRGCFTPENKVVMYNNKMVEISKIDIGDRVISRSGVGKVTNKFVYNINEEIVELEFENGVVIRCTKDHKILTDNGYVEANKITYNDDITNIVYWDQLKSFKVGTSFKLIGKKYIKYNGKVYDLCVEEDHSYNIGGIIVHNSAAGSVVSYLLGIVHVDPIKNGLFFERFLNEARIKTDSADIDMDIDSDTLPKIEEYLKEEYGKKAVCHIANFTTFKVKNTIKDMARVLCADNDLSTINNVTKSFSDTGEDVDEEWQKAKARFKNGSKEELWLNLHEKDVLKWARKLVGRVRNIGQHASGKLIVPGELHEHIPLLFHKGEVLTGFMEGGKYRELPEVGMMKLDLLGLNTCSIINEAIELIKTNDKNFKLDNKSVYYIDKNDPEILKDFKNGKTNNIFQYSSPGMKALLKGINTDRFSDLTLVNALYRPGALGANSHKHAISNKKIGAENIEYIHEKLRPILENEYGVPVYQEHTMQIFTDIGGFNLVEADKARKTIKLLGKKVTSQEEKDNYHRTIDKFSNKAKEHGITQDQIDKILVYLNSASEYSFNKCLGGNTNILTPSGIKNIKNIKIGDVVYSYDYELNRKYETFVLNVHNNGKMGLYSVETDDGCLLQCTYDHKFMTSDGCMKPLKSILEKNLKIVKNIGLYECKHIGLKNDTLTRSGGAETYDLEINDINHNFIIEGGFVSSNSHSMSYATLAYAAMYLKHNYPLEFYCAVLKRTNNIDDKISTIINDIKEDGINVKFVDINKSGFAFEVKDGEIFGGFDFIKGIKSNDVNSLVNGQPFLSIRDFLKKVLEDKLSKKTVHPLIQLGIVDSLYSNRKKLFMMYETAKTACKKKNFNWDDLKDIIVKIHLDNSIEDYSKIERANFELLYFGFYFRENLLSSYKKNIDLLNAVSISELPATPKSPLAQSGFNKSADIFRYKFPVAGVITQTKAKKTKNGKNYYTITISSVSNNGDTQSLSFKVWEWTSKELEKKWNTECKKLFEVGSVIVARVDKNSFGYSLQGFERGCNNDILNFPLINLSLLDVAKK